MPVINYQNLSLVNNCIIQDITISGPVSWNNSNFRISPNTRIIIPSGSKLSITNSRLSACADMWQGIEVQDGGSLLISNSIIEDAIVAVDVSNHISIPPSGQSILFLNNVVFNKNLTSVAINNFPHQFNSNVFRFWGCVFTCRNLVKPLLTNISTFISNIKSVAIPANPNTPYASDRISEILYPRSVLKAPFTGQIPDMGIYLEKVGQTVSPLSNPVFYEFLIGLNSTTTNQTTYFDNMNNGIISVNSNLAVYNTIFQNMDGGNGIRAISDGVNYLNRVQVTKSFPASIPNKFIDCGYGISTENIFIHEITNNEFRSSKPLQKSSSGDNAVWATTFVNADFTVKDNTIYNYKNGIVFAGSIGNLNGLGINATSLYTDVVAINNNTIIPNMPGAVLPQNYVSNAITVFNVYDPKYFIYPKLTKAISINTNSITAYRGIYVSGFAKLKFNVNDNIINLEKDVVTQPATEYGILMSECYASAKGNIYNNFIKGDVTSYLNSQNYAILMKNCSGLILSCNETRRTYNGLAFNAYNSQVSVFNNIMRNQIVGFLLDNNGVVGASYGTVPHSIGTIGQPADNQWIGGQWNQPGRYKTFTNNSTAQSSPMYVQSGGVFDPSGFGGTNSALIIDLYSSIPINNSIRLTAGPTPVNCGTGMPPALIINNNQVSVFENIVQNQNPVFGNVTKVRRVQKNNVFKELKADQNLLQSSTVLQSFYNNELSTNNEAYATIEEQIAQEQLTQASNGLAAVSNQDDVDNNHQTYNTCMLHYKDSTQTFTTTDSANLVNLCQKCPYTDGFVVFRARALYNLVFKTVEAFVDNCDNNALNRVADTFTDEEDDKDELLKVELYPNPSTGKLSIITETENEVLDVIVTDVAGKEVYNQKLNIVNYTTDFTLQVKNGFYFVEMRGLKNKIIKKIVINN